MAKPMTEQRRQDLTVAVMEFLDAWQVGPTEQIKLLGLDSSIRRRMLIRYRRGTPLPQDDVVIKRASDLVAIGNALLTVFPHSVPSANLWVTTPQIMFGNCTPLAVMLEDSDNGIARILLSLDNTGGW
jgi:hypothetical protein